MRTEKSCANMLWTWICKISSLKKLETDRVRPSYHPWCMWCLDVKCCTMQSMKDIINKKQVAQYIWNLLIVLIYIAQLVSFIILIHNLCLSPFSWVAIIEILYVAVSSGEKTTSSQLPWKVALYFSLLKLRASIIQITFALVIGVLLFF